MSGSNQHDPDDIQSSVEENQEHLSGAYLSVDILKDPVLSKESSIDQSKTDSTSNTLLQSRNAEVAVILVTIFVDYLAFGIIFPVIPFLAMKFGASGLMIGLLSSSYNIFSFFGSTLLGRLSDKIGRKPVLVVSLVGTTLGAILLGVSNSLAWIFVARSIAGFCGGSVPVANAYIADITTEEERPKFFGLVGAVVGIGLVCGPAVGGLLRFPVNLTISHYNSRFGFSWVAFSAAFIAGPNVLFALFVLKESPKKYHQENKLSLQQLKTVFLNRNILALLITEFLLSYSFMSLESMFPLYLNKRFGTGSNYVGYILTLYGICTAVTQGLAIGILRKYVSDKILAIIGITMFGISMILTNFVTIFAWIIVVTVCNSIADGLFTPTLSSLVSNSAPANMQGLVMGFMESVNSLGRVVSPFASGALLDVNVLYPNYVAGCFALVAALTALFVGTKGKDSHEGVEYTELQTVPEMEGLSSEQ